MATMLAGWNDATMQRCNDATMQRCNDAAMQRWNDGTGCNRVTGKGEKTKVRDKVAAR